MWRSLSLILACSPCFAGGICSKTFVQKRVFVVDNAYSSNYHSVGALYNEALIEQIVERAVVRAVQAIQQQQPIPPAEPSGFATKYPVLASNCLGCHGDSPKDNELSFTQHFRDNGELSCELRLKCLQEIDSGRMPKGKTLDERSAQDLFTEIVHGKAKQ